MKRSETQMTDHRIRRRPDGSIDTQFYLSRGQVARSQQAHRIVRGS